MQTFLPHANLKQSVRVLDYRRLGKQRVETMQLLSIIQGNSKAWKNHPCTIMWADYTKCLEYYKDLCISEWIKRGYNNTMQFKKEWLLPNYIFPKDKMPPWIGLRKFHSSHRAALLFKQPEHYQQFGWAEEPKLDYYWPSKQNG